jgi:hypothetical protein
MEHMHKSFIMMDELTILHVGKQAVEAANVGHQATREQ